MLLNFRVLSPKSGNFPSSSNSSPSNTKCLKSQEKLLTINTNYDQIINKVFSMNLIYQKL